MSYLAQRLLHGAGVVLGVSVIVFGLTWLRGDPTSVLVPLNTPPAEMERLRHDLGLDRPLPVQYVEFLGRAIKGDFGLSLRQRQPALPLVLERLPATLFLVSSALLFALVVGIPLGMLAATFHGGPPDLVAGLVRLLRTGMLEVLSADYIRAARAKGLPERVVLFKHALRNAALPTLTFIGVQLGFLFGNSVVAEAIFAYPGMGRLAVDAIGARDLPLIQAFVALAAIVVVLASLLVDSLYVWLDPRVRLACSV